MFGLTPEIATQDAALPVSRIHPEDLLRVRRGQIAVCREDAGVIEYRIRDALLIVQLASGDHVSSFHGTASGVVELKTLRSALRQWLARLDLDKDTQYDVLLAAGEACANSVEHAYGSGHGPVERVGAVHHGTVELTVSDGGAWIGPPSESQRDQGLLLMRSLVDAVTVRATGSGTVVSLTKHLRSTST